MWTAVPAFLLVALIAVHGADTDKDDETKLDEEACRWRPAVEGKRNSGNEVVTLTDIDIEDCKAKVEEDADKSYKSIEYNKDKRTCYLQKVDRDTHRLTVTDVNYVYLEYDCFGTYPDECQWEGPFEGYIGGTTIVTLKDYTQDMCKEACEQDTTFNCKSFDYLHSSWTCYLKLISQYGAKLVPHKSYQHYTRNCQNKFRGCSITGKGTWSSPVHGYYINAGNLLTLTKTTVEQCKEACLARTDFHCLGFDYDHVSEYCNLKSGAEFLGNYLVASASMDYYRLEECEYAEPVKTPAKECRWLRPQQGYISGQDKKTFKSMGAEQCKRSCEREDDFHCASFDYLETSKTCYLQEASRATHTVTFHTSYIYYERDCSSSLVEKCEWEGPYVGKYISGNDIKTLTGIEDIQTCKEACEAETSFTCMSFDHLKTSKYCYLHRITIYDAKLSVSASYDYYERNCFDEYRSCSQKSGAVWKDKVPGKYLAGNDLRTLNGKTVEQCKEACMQSSDYHCISIDHRRKDNTCYLQGKNTATFQLTSHTDYDFYEIEKCKGNETAAPMPDDIEEKRKSCEWIGPYKGKYMSSNDWKTLTNIELDACKEACEDYTGCMSVDYYVAPKYCYLNKYNRNKQALSSHASYYYYEIKCETELFPEECEWMPVMQNKYIHGYDYRTLYDLDVKECKEACEEEEDFNCRSFDYLIANRRCYLSLSNRYGLALSASTSYAYYERNCRPNLRTCSKDAETTWIGPMHGKYINANMRTFNSITVEQCKIACVTVKEFHCTGFYFQSGSSNCYLLAKNRLMGGVVLEHASYDYYEIVECDGDVAPVTTDGGCKWRPAFTGRYLSGNDNLKLYNLDIAGCKKACEEATAFKCKSFDVYSNGCYLSSKDRSDTALSSHASYTYYEMDCEDECKWNPVQHRRYISGNDHKTLYTADIDECKKACEDEKEFRCYSFDFYRASARCLLTFQNRYKVKLSTHADYDYYERDCRPKVRDCKEGASAVWVGPIIGYQISGYDLLTLNNIDVEACQQACLQQTDFNCVSFDWARNTRNCYLQAVSRKEVPLVVSAAQYQYYEIVSCKLGPNVPKPTVNTNFEWDEPKKGMYISGSDKKTLDNFNVEDCKEACEKESAFRCRSFDYLPAYRRCYLQEVTAFTAVLSYSASYLYYEMNFDDNFPDECEWEPVQYRTYLGGAKKTLKTMTVEMCIEACEEEDTFHCTSFDYYVPTLTCYLNPITKYDKSTAYNANYNYYERNCHDKYRNCNEDALVGWTKPRHGKYINKFLKTLKYMDIDTCKAACLQETDFHCRSITFDRSGKNCYLLSAISAENALINHANYDYYEITECKSVDRKKRDTSDEEEKKSDDGCVWSGSINNYYLNGNDKKTLTGVMPGDCMKACDEETTFICKSFDFKYDSRTCYLSDKNRMGNKLTFSGAYQFYEKNCDKNFPSQCQWEKVRGAYINGYDWATYTGITSSAACRDLCEMECAFHCMGVDYISSQSKCLLNYANRYTVALSRSTSYDFYERNCINTFKTCHGDAEGIWEGPRYGKGLTGWKTLKTINKLTIDQCKRACQQSTDFHCRSFIWHRSNNNCYLSSQAEDTNPIVNNLDYNLYQLQGCEGDLPEMEETEPKECVPEDFYVASCSCSGDPHCLSYDGLWLHFQGSCFYTTSRDGCENGVPTSPPTWEVIQNNNGNGVSYVRQAQVNLYEYDLEIGLYVGGATVNGVRVPGSPMMYADGKVKITLGSQIIITVKGSMQVKFASSYIWVGTLATSRGKVCGLCGNFDGDKTNDWTIGNSKYCMKKYPTAKVGEITTDTNVMGTSWTAKMDEAEASCINNCPNPPPPVGCDATNGPRAEEHCDILQSNFGAFKTCIAKMTEDQRKEIFDNCVFDACSLDNYDDIVCRHAASLAKICVDQFNIKVTWRTATFCPMKCEGENTEYQPCGNPCFPTCGDRAGQNCGDLGPCGEGCFCKKGFVFDGKKDCIPEGNCGCEVPDLGIYINVGDSYKAPDCSTACTCTEAGADLECEDMTCGDNYECGAKNGDPACLCLPPFIEEDGVCKELTNPCVDDEALKCFTCDSPSDEDCYADGTMKFCDGDDAICKYEQFKDDEAKIKRVKRGCAKRNDCIPDSIGLGVLFCDEELDTDICTRCNFGDTDKDGEGDTVTGDCGIPPKPTTPAPLDPCEMPMDNGEGKGNKVQRFFYNSETRKCVQFVYKAPGGNENNFKTIEECQEACGYEPPNVCEMPKDAGDGDGKTKRFYFDNKKKACKAFPYTGSGGNGNNFKSKKACLAECTGKDD